MSESQLTADSPTIPPSQSEKLRMEFLTWINDELRKEIEEQEEFEDDGAGFIDRVRSFLAAAMS